MSSFNMNNDIFSILNYLLFHMHQNNSPCINILKVNFGIRSLFLIFQYRRLGINRFQNIRRLSMQHYIQEECKKIKLLVFTQQTRFYKYIYFRLKFLLYYHIRYIHLMCFLYNYNNSCDIFSRVNQNFHNSLKYKHIRVNCLYKFLFKVQFYKLSIYERH